MNFALRTVLGTVWETLVRVVLTTTLVTASQVLETKDSIVRVFAAGRTFQSQALTFTERSTHSDDVVELRLGDSLSRELSGGGLDSFKIHALPQQFFHILVEQHGIDLTVELFRPDGGSVVKIESVSGAYGPIHVYEIANTPGDYKLEVRSSEGWAIAGRYEIKVQALRASDAADTARIAAQRAFAEGQDLLSRASKQTGNEATESRKAAVEKFSTAKQRWHELGDAHGEVISMYQAGATYQRRLGKSSEAREIMLQALALAPQLGASDWRLEASLWNDLGVIYNNLYDEKNAQKALGNALRIFDEHHDRRGRASVHNNLGLVFLQLGQAREAQRVFKVALPIRKAENDKANELITLNNIGGAHERLGEPRQALDHYQRALQGWRETNNQSQIPTGLNNVARAKDTLGLWQEARDNYEEALGLAAKQGAKRNEAIFLYNIGDLYGRLNDPESALKNFHRALSIHQEFKNARDEANVLAHIAQIYLSQGRPDQALEDYTRALQLMGSSDAVESRRVQAYTLIGIATVYLASDLPRALEYSEKARRLSQEIGDLQEEADALEKMGQVHNALADQPKALASFNSALVLRKALEDPLGEASTLFHIARLKSDLGELSEAAKLSAEMLKIVESLHGSVVSQQLRTSYLAKTQSYYEIYIDVQMRLFQLNHQESHRLDALAANERRRARGLADSLMEGNADIRRGASPALAAKMEENEEKLNSKGRLKQLLLNELAVMQRSFNKQPSPAKQSRVNELKQRLANLSDDLSALITDYDDLQTRNRISSRGFASLTQSTPIGLKEIQRQLTDDTLFLEYSLSDKRSYVWAITSDSITSFELTGRDEIEALAQRVSTGLTARGLNQEHESWLQRNERIKKAEADYLVASAALSKLVLEPVASLLGARRLVVIADGTLQLIPFAALPVPAGSVTDSTVSTKRKLSKTVATKNEMAPMIKDHEIVGLPSASFLALQRRELGHRKPADRALAVLANPVFDGQDTRVNRAKNPRAADRTVATKPQPTDNHNGTAAGSAARARRPQALTDALRDVGLNRISSLPFSQREAEAIVKVAPRGKTLLALNFDASRETAISPELSKYRIIHIATHGIMDLEHPELSGVVLSLVDQNGQELDGYLRLHEIYNLNLPAELVVLSACQTGVGKHVRGEGLIALTRGFMYAGAKSVVASFWKVDDTATSELMAEFYKQMFTNKLKPAAALREAQLKLSQQKRWQSPYYWAGFFLQGDWD